MRLRHDKTLITGRPGVGKTTLILLEVTEANRERLLEVIEGSTA
jgi:nucleoside-triphosphatase THEP1